MIRLITALILMAWIAGCSQHQNLDTTAWARGQDSIFDGGAQPGDRNQWNDLYRLQQHLTPSNLSLREALIRGDVSHAVSDYRGLSRDGYWAEGWSYWCYSITGILWFNHRSYPPLVSQDTLDAIEARYHHLTAPDGSIPLSETAGGPGDPDTASYYEDDHYLVLRWPKAYLLVVLDTDPEPRLNMHHHLAAGYVALWIDGRWVIRCTPYTGFAWDKAANDAGLDSLLPAGAWSPLWRVQPWPVTVSRGQRSVTIRWPQGGAERVVGWTDSGVVGVTDNGVRRWWIVTP